MNGKLQCSVVLNRLWMRHKPTLSGRTSHLLLHFSLIPIIRPLAMVERCTGCNHRSVRLADVLCSSLSLCLHIMQSRISVASHDPLAYQSTSLPLTTGATSHPFHGCVSAVQCSLIHHPPLMSWLDEWESESSLPSHFCQVR